MIKRPLLCIALCIGTPLSVAASGTVNFADLAVLRDAKPGLWQHSFTTIPTNPVAPARTEKACVSQVTLTAMLDQLKSPGGGRSCDVEMKSNFANKAEGVMHCPGIDIPQAGVHAPGADMPIVFEKIGTEEHWVVTVRVPAVPGNTPAAIWRHEYRRLGQCPG
jgi:hypothetical protein